MDVRVTEIKDDIERILVEPVKGIVSATPRCENAGDYVMKYLFRLMSASLWPKVVIDHDTSGLDFLFKKVVSFDFPIPFSCNANSCGTCVALKEHRVDE